MPSTSTTPDRVLSTLNQDGSRRWLHPRLSLGRFLRRRRIVAWGLILLFSLIPWITIDGRPSVLIDLPARRLHLLGATFLPTDTLLLMLFVAGVFVTIFLVTALFGRLWCGWACPQTVYMEFVYRPIERFFEGVPDARGRRRSGARGLRKVLKYVVFFLVSAFIANTFLAYFVGVERLGQWMTRSPVEHPTGFLVMAAVTGLMMFDFCFFREQTCIVACPYGRFQSAMLDRSSLIIQYDEKRGEPRGRIRRKKGRPGTGAGETADAGDCVDCGLCVTTCPTGIDIREGLQLECIGCAQCIDACDAVMEKVNRPAGLVRYSSQTAMEEGKKRLLRPRVLIYPFILLVIGTLFVTQLLGRQPADVTLLRVGGRPYVSLSEAEVANELQIKIVNRTESPRRFSFGVSGIDGARIEADSPVTVIDGGETATTRASIVVPRDSFEQGRAAIEVTVRDESGFSRDFRYRLQGPWGGRAPGDVE